MSTLSRFFWLLLPFIFLVGSAVYVPLKLNDDMGYKRVESIKSELELLNAKNREIKKENAILRQQIKAIVKDPDFIENIARNEMGMIAKDEIVYQF
ncbi:MAG: septum formation initiator family protein [Deltaproteobacteria bacterium]|nr:septum formation initiator family protein [Deltaproteobacteria bacterium]